MSSARLGTLAVALVFALLAVVVAWQLSRGVSTTTLLASAILTCPLWAPLRGLMRHDRKTYAWATLCVIPYLVLGLTEAIASERRLWAAVCVGIAFALFVTLILYLRVSNPQRRVPSPH